MSNEEVVKGTYASSPMTDKINTEYNSLTMSQMDVGTKIEGVLKSVDPQGSEYGATLTLALDNGQDIKIFPCGNIKKFFCAEVVSGERPVGTKVRFTRKPDKKVRGKQRTFETSDFAVFQEGYTPPAFRDKDNNAAKPAGKASPSLEEVKAQLS